MGVADKMWDAITTVIKMNDKAERMAATIKTQQEEIEGLTERIIRIQSALEIALASRGARFGERDRRFRSIVTGRFGNVTDAGGRCCGCSNCSFSDRRQVIPCCLWKMGQRGALFLGYRISMRRLRWDLWRALSSRSCWPRVFAAIRR
jgi:hypothetical protein